MANSLNMKKPEQWQVDDAARLKLIFKESGHTQEEFGALFNIGNQSMVGQYLNCRRPLNMEAVGNFSRGLKVPIDQISPTLANQIQELNALVTHSHGYVPISTKGEIAARIVDSMKSGAQQDKAIKIVTTLAEPEGNHGSTPMRATK